MVPGETFALCGTLLDGRLDGDDHPECSRTSAALRLGHYEIPAGAGYDGCIPGDDAEFDLLGAFERSLWEKAGKL